MEIDKKRNEMLQIVNDSGLEKTKAQYLLDNFSEYFAIAADWEIKAKAIKVTDENQTAEMKMAREGRLFLRQKRIDVENARKKLKEQALREGKAIDGIANVLKAVIVPIEEYLDDQEHYIERKRAAEEETRRLEAEKLLKEKEEKEKAEREAEEKRIREDNERLRKEAEKREAEIKKEREISERKAAEERAKQAAAYAAERKRAEAIAEKARKEAEKREAEIKKVKEELMRHVDKEKASVTCPKCKHIFFVENNEG